MSPKRLVNHIDAVEGTVTDISDATLSLKTVDQIRDKVDTFEVKLAYKDLPQRTYFDTEDGIQIYLGSTDAPTQLAFDGLVKDFQFDESKEGRTYTIKGNSRIDSLITNQTSMTEFAQTADYIGSRLIEFANKFNSGNPTWIQLVWSGNPSLTQVNDFNKQSAPIYQHMKEISTNEYTGDGQYMYMLGADGSTVIWKSEPSITTGSFTEGVNLEKISVGKSEFDVVNEAIIDGGLDFNGASIKRPVFNTTSIGKVGKKTKYFTDDNIAKQAKFASGLSPAPATPFGDATGWTGGNANFRSYVGDLIKQKWQPIINTLGMPRYKVEVEVPPSLGYEGGDLWQFKIPSIGWSDGGEKSLRLVSVSQDVGKDWKTKLNYEQDAEAAVSDMI